MKRAHHISLSTGVAILLGCSLAACAADVEYHSSRLSGKVVDAAGMPLAGATVLVNNTQGAEVDLESISDWTTTTDKDGSYTLTLRYKKGQTLSVREVFADMPGYVRGAPKLRLPLADGKPATLDFRLEKGEVISGEIKLPLLPDERDLPDEALKSYKRVFEIIGKPIESLTINARCFLTGIDGKFEVYVPPGEYTLRAVSYDFESIEWKGIRSGQKDLVLELPEYEWSEATVGAAFDDLWKVIDNNYSYFFLKPDVDWPAMREKFRPAAVQSKNAAELGLVLKEMLSQLKDMHVWIETPTGYVGTQAGGYQYNGNREVTLSQLQDRVECGKFAIVGPTRQDGFGYFLMLRQSEANKENVKQAIDAIHKLRDAPGFVVDLRTANGGAEPLAADIASQFCAAETVYAKSKYRNGKRHDEFGEVYDRKLPPSPEPYTKPVLCLIGPGAVSSGEGFVKMMKCLPHVVTVGLPTRGSSGNPKPWRLSRTGLTVYYSSWVDMLPDGTPIEGVGIAPEVRFERSKSDYQSADPTLEKGLELLRVKIEAADKRSQ